MGVGLSRAWVSSSSACVTASSEGILVNEMVSGKKLWCRILAPNPSWGCRMLVNGNVASLA